MEWSLASNRKSTSKSQAGVSAGTILPQNLADALAEANGQGPLGITSHRHCIAWIYVQFDSLQFGIYRRKLRCARDVEWMEQSLDFIMYVPTRICGSKQGK